MTQDEWDKLPPVIRASLSQRGVGPASLAKSTAKLPYTAAASPQTPVADMANMSDSLGGITTRTIDGRKSMVVLNPDPKNTYAKTAPGHEFDHVLANQGLGAAHRVNDKFDELRAQDYKGKPNADEQAQADRARLMAALIKHAPHLVKNWGLPQEDTKDGYFSPEMAQLQGARAPNLFYEQAATLSALEQAKNKRLTDDPYMRENVFNDPGLREVYNALTGLRQTRLDAKDLPPYTRQPDKSDAPAQAEGWMRKLKQLMGQ